MKINYIRWWDAKSYKNGVSMTDWVKSYNSIAMSMYAIVMFDPRKHSELDKTNGERCAYAVRREFAPKHWDNRDKIEAAKVVQDAYKEALRAKKTLEKTGKWPDFDKEEFHVAVKM